MVGTDKKSPFPCISTLWWQITQHFELRGRQVQHSMRVEDFFFRKDETGTSYIVYAEGVTKTRQSGLHKKSWLQLPKMFETQSKRCPVKLESIFQNTQLGLKSQEPFICNQL